MGLSGAIGLVRALVAGGMVDVGVVLLVSYGQTQMVGATSAAEVSPFVKQDSVQCAQVRACMQTIATRSWRR